MTEDTILIYLIWFIGFMGLLYSVFLLYFINQYLKDRQELIRMIEKLYYNESMNHEDRDNE